VKCKFNENRECIQAKLFERWSHDKKEVAWLTLGVCPQCSVYAEGLNSEEGGHDKES
jgi:hypothetical protein